jgi:purine-nucleoside phosphorylase
MIQDALTHLRKHHIPDVKLAIILGSGLGTFADDLTDAIIIETAQIPNYPVSTVEGHEGKIIFGYWKRTPIMAIKGRTHYYEGYSLKQVTFIVRILQALGIKIVIITNAAGGVNRRLKPGDLMLITDHINFMFANPLIGPLDYGGLRFPDMSVPYAEEYRIMAEQAAHSKGISLKKGTLYASSGPSYETRSEIKMIEKLGADAVSMSTVPEVIVARHAGLNVIGLSCITNMATGRGDYPLSHKEVTRTAQLVKKKFIYLITGIIENLEKSKRF